MKKFTLHLALWCALIPSLVKAQDKKWFVEAGPYVGISAWTLSVGHSLGIGGDAGVGYSFGGGESVTGFARTGYLGYQFMRNGRLFTIAPISTGPHSQPITLV